MRQLCAIRREERLCEGARAWLPDRRGFGSGTYALTGGRKVSWTHLHGRFVELLVPPPLKGEPGEGDLHVEEGEDDAVSLIEWKERRVCLIAYRSGLLFEFSTSGYDACEPVLVGQVPGVCGLAASPDGEHVVVATSEGTMIAFNSEYEVVAEVPLGVDFEESPVIISWRGDGMFLATNSKHAGHRNVRVWERQELVHHSDAELEHGIGEALSWEPRGGLLAVAVNDGREVQLLERNGLKRGSTVIQQREGVIKQLSWSHDSDLLAVVVNHVPAIDSGECSCSLDPFSSKHAVQVWNRCNHHWWLKWHEYLHGETSVLWDDEQDKVLHIVNHFKGVWTTVQFVWDDAQVSCSGTGISTDGCNLLLNTFQTGVVPPPMCNMKIVCSAPIVAAAVATCTDEVVAAVLSSGGLVVACPNSGETWADSNVGIGTQCGQEAVDGTFHAQEIPMELPDNSVVRQVTWLENEKLVLLTNQDKGGTYCDTLITLTVQDGTDGRVKPEIEHISTVQDCPGFEDKVVLRIAALGGKGSQKVFVSLASRDTGSNLQEPSSFIAEYDGPQLRIICTCKGFCFWLFPFHSIVDAAPHYMARTSHGELLLDGKHVASNVRSFTSHLGDLHETHLYITKNNVLHSVPHLLKESKARILDDHNGTSPLGRDADIFARKGEGNQQNWQTRLVENGARLVAAPAHAPLVILQMPRGNLEGIYPRSLVLTSVLNFLEKQLYSDAFAVARRHRLDLNILVDYRWPFAISTEGARVIVSSLAEKEKLAELVHALKEGNVLHEDGVYGGLVQSPSLTVPANSEGNMEVSSKVSSLCLALRTAMEGVDSLKYALPILSTYIRHHPPQLGEALLCALRMTSSTNTDESAEFCNNLSNSTQGQRQVNINMQGIMKHLLLYCEEEELYRAALGLYNLELAAIVVSHSQSMDPGEKLPELHALDNVTPIKKQRAMIDIRLGRLRSAAKHLSEVGDWSSFEECLVLAGQAPDEVYPVLLEQFPSGTATKEREAKLLRASFGDSLISRGRPEEAALAYLSAGKLSNAMDAYRAAGAWRMVLSLAGRMGLDNKQIRSMALDLAEEIRLAAPRDAATIFLEYANDTQKAVQILASVGSWRDALHVSYCAQRADLVDTLLGPAAAAATETALEEFKDDEGRLRKYSARLRTLRQRQAAFAAIEESEKFAEIAEDASSQAFSEVGTSVMSECSAYTHRTASSGTLNGASSLSSASAASAVGRRDRRSRNKERKKGRIRAGAPNEEQELLRHLSECAMPPNQRESYGELCELLVLLGHESDAKLLQGSLANLVAFQDRLAQESSADLSAARQGLAADRPYQPVIVKAKWKWSLLRTEVDTKPV